jgi:hypothetical protein
MLANVAMSMQESVVDMPHLTAYCDSGAAGLDES